MRHYQALSFLATQTGKTLTEVLAGILEKVLRHDLKLITDADDLIDENPSKWLTAQVARFRKNPSRLQKILEKRSRDLAIIQDCFPEDLTRDDHDVITRLRYAVDMQPKTYEAQKKSPPKDVKKLARQLRSRKSGTLNMYEEDMHGEGS